MSLLVSVAALWLVMKNSLFVLNQLQRCSDVVTRIFALICGTIFTCSVYLLGFRSFAPLQLSLLSLSFFFCLDTDVLERRKYRNQVSTFMTLKMSKVLLDRV